MNGSSIANSGAESRREVKGGRRYARISPGSRAGDEFATVGALYPEKALADMVGKREEEWYHGSKLSSLWGTKVFLYAGAARAFEKNKEVDL